MYNPVSLDMEINRNQCEMTTSKMGWHMGWIWGHLSWMMRRILCLSLNNRFSRNSEYTSVGGLTSSLVLHENTQGKTIRSNTNTNIMSTGKHRFKGHDHVSHKLHQHIRCMLRLDAEGAWILLFVCYCVLLVSNVTWPRRVAMRAERQQPLLLWKNLQVEKWPCIIRCL